MAPIDPIPTGTPINPINFLPTDNAKKVNLRLVASDGTSVFVDQKKNFSIIEFLEIPGDARVNLQQELLLAQELDVAQLRNYINEQFKILQEFVELANLIEAAGSDLAAALTDYNNSLPRLFFNSSLNAYIQDPVLPQFDPTPPFNTQLPLTQAEKDKIDNLFAVQDSYNAAIQPFIDAINLAVQPLLDIGLDLADLGVVSFINIPLRPTDDASYKQFVLATADNPITLDLSDFIVPLAFDLPELSALIEQKIGAIGLEFVIFIREQNLNVLDVIRDFVNKNLADQLIAGNKLVLPTAFIARQPEPYLTVGGSGSSPGISAESSIGGANVRQEALNALGMYKSIAQNENVPLTSKNFDQFQLLTLELINVSALLGAIKAGGLLGSNLGELSPAGAGVIIPLAFSVADRARELIKEGVIVGKIEELVRGALIKAGTAINDEQLARVVVGLSSVVNITLLQFALNELVRSLGDASLSPQLLGLAGLSASDIQAGIAGTSEVDTFLKDPLGILFLKSNLLNTAITQLGFTSDAASSIQAAFSEVLKREYNTLAELNSAFNQAFLRVGLNGQQASFLADEAIARVRGDLGQRVLSLGLSPSLIASLQESPTAILNLSDANQRDLAQVAATGGFETLRELRDQLISAKLSKENALQRAIVEANITADALRKDILGDSYEKEALNKAEIQREFAKRIEQSGQNVDSDTTIKNAESQVESQGDISTNTEYAALLRQEILKSNQGLSEVISGGVSQTEGTIELKNAQEIRASIENVVSMKLDGKFSDEKVETLTKQTADSAISTAETLKKEIERVSNSKTEVYEALKETLVHTKEQTEFYDNVMRPAHAMIGSLAGAMGRKRSIDFWGGV